MSFSSNSSQDHRLRQSQTDRLGRHLAQHLNAQVPLAPDIQARLQAARAQALAAAVRPAPASGWQRWLRKLHHAPNAWWNTLAATAALATFSLSFMLLSNAQLQQETADVARVDTLLLTDDVPPEAYADPGFVQFLRNAPQSDTE